MSIKHDERCINKNFGFVELFKMNILTLFLACLILAFILIFFGNVFGGISSGSSNKISQWLYWTSSVTLLFSSFPILHLSLRKILSLNFFKPNLKLAETLVILILLLLPIIIPIIPSIDYSFKKNISKLLGFNLLFIAALYIVNIAPSIMKKKVEELLYPKLVLHSINLLLLHTFLLIPFITSSFSMGNVIIGLINLLLLEIIFCLIYSACGALQLQFIRKRGE